MFGSDSLQTRAEADPLLTRAALASAALAYLGPHDPGDPLASPLFGDLADLPPVPLQVGEDEVPVDDSRRYEMLASTAGTRSQLHVWAGMPHGFLDHAARPEQMVGRPDRRTKAHLGKAVRRLKPAVRVPGASDIRFRRQRRARLDRGGELH